MRVQPSAILVVKAVVVTSVSSATHTGDWTVSCWWPFQCPVSAVICIRKEKKNCLVLVSEKRPVHETQELHSLEYCLQH